MLDSRIEISFRYPDPTCSRGGLAVGCRVRDLLRDPREVRGRDAEGRRQGDGESAGREEAVPDGLDVGHVVPREPRALRDPAQRVEPLQVLLLAFVVRDGGGAEVCKQVCHAGLVASRTRVGSFCCMRYIATVSN